jgi:hypothetical protein
MANLILPSRFIEHFSRLLLGVQPMDAVRLQRLAHRVDIVVEPRKPWVDPLTPDQQSWLRALADEGTPLSDWWPRASRHPGNRHAVTYEAGRGTHLDLRILDVAERIVPRRLRVPLVDLGTPESLALLDALPVGRRSRFPAFHPGAAYDVSDRATGLRGRVVVSTGGQPPGPVRWPRVEARLGARGAPLAWAHGDRHGEFLLILPPEAIAPPATALPAALTLQVTAYGRKGFPAVLRPALMQAADPFWDLPLEEIGAPGIAPDLDLVALGRVIPADYNGSFTQSVTFTYSLLISSGIPPFDIT